MKGENKMNENETQNIISFEQTSTTGFEQTNTINTEASVAQGNMGGKKKGKAICGQKICKREKN